MAFYLCFLFYLNICGRTEQEEGCIQHVAISCLDIPHKYIQTYPQPLKVLFAYQLTLEKEIKDKHYLCAELQSAVPIYIEVICMITEYSTVCSSI